MMSILYSYLLKSGQFCSKVSDRAIFKLSSQEESNSKHKRLTPGEVYYMMGF